MPLTKPSKYTPQELLNQNANDNGVITFSTAPTPPSTLTSGAKVTVSTAAVQLVASATAARRVTIQAFSSNTGIIAVGGANVLAAIDTTAVGIQLNAGDAYELDIDIDDLSKVWIRATVSGEGVTFVATAGCCIDAEFSTRLFRIPARRRSLTRPVRPRSLCST